MEGRLVKIDERGAEPVCRGSFPNAGAPGRLQPATAASGSQTPTHRPYAHKIKAVGALRLENVAEQPRSAGIHYRGNVCLRGHGSPLSPAVKRKSGFSLP